MTLSNRNSITHSPRIVGAGMIVLDIILNNGSKTPIYMAGGSCGNVLAGLSFLGWQGVAVSRAGRDTAGTIMIEDLERNGVDTNYVKVETKVKTPRIIEKLNSNGEYAKHSFALRCSKCNTYLPRFQDIRLDMIDKVQAMYENTNVYFFDKVTTSILRLAEYYRNSGSLVFFEPKNLKNLEEIKEAMAVAHIMKYSETESGKSEAKKSKEISKLSESKNVSLVIRTRGQDGISFKMLNDDVWRRRKSYAPGELIDTCGAGDWSTIGFLFHLNRIAQRDNSNLLQLVSSKKAIDEALKFGQILSSLKCMFVGARGLSNCLDRESILKIVESNFYSDKLATPCISNHQDNAEEKEINSGSCTENHTCPICLLE